MESKYPSIHPAGCHSQVPSTWNTPPNSPCQGNHMAHSLALFGALLKCPCISQGNKYKADGGGVFSMLVSGTQVLSIGCHSQLNTWPPTSPRQGDGKGPLALNVLAKK